MDQILHAVMLVTVKTVIIAVNQRKESSMPPVKYDTVLVVDLECSCWDGPTPPGEYQEIIEIGVAEVSLAEKRILRSESIVVKPLMSTVSEYCTELTGWTQEQVDGGLTLLHATQKLQQEYNSLNRMWLSQGNFDRRMFLKNCAMYGVPYPFSDSHLNIAALYGLLTRRVRGTGMMRQLAALKLEPEGKHHSGRDDAVNSARVLLELLKRGRVDVTKMDSR